MKYRFNDRVLFDGDTGTLGPSDFSDEPTAISNPAKRLLLLLIANYGKPVEREVIFKKVWDDYGMISSNNNLNQCVSKLRRVLKVMGIDDEVIVTVPKIGFMLRREIQVEISQEDDGHFTPLVPAQTVSDEAYLPLESGLETEAETDDDIASTSEADDEPDLPTSVEIAAPANKKRLGWGLIATVAGLVFVLGIASTMYATNSLARQEVFLGKAGSCKVFMSTSTQSGVPSSSLNQDMLSYVEQRKAECRADEYLLVVRSNQVRSFISGVSRLFFVRCTIVREHKIEFCSGLENDSLPLLQ
ncbi:MULTISPECIES: transcriptional regulator [Serratia]|uniref:transcriptional regulator n=1 Tax=Serratia TaxID=613 RepID=UPI0003AE81CE|nr:MULTISPECIES: winged helix-turn-helix domain-containing protein [Serratia]ERK13238.1 transcriptional regulator, CadC [Serratia fonticola AU-AP2C]MBP0998407.1 winged helix-turn-helix domain-containing protein [Serratia fonticola]MBP1001518.1 winged helix-turn-helix domain-containing protein [Serratia fonticola]MBP1011306.1 winged helix-turn-helix domain-containing protein [Serratia fonticola]MBP1018635.1 winged helix-turn-helix domain-containing protein [Serratia fonticola]